mmetsp:Transcript_45023/g.105625  ORF Transcript_45023/g.105625 Transcript_45023/m.105625 type:complete len:212 (+) Transcript_45023:326-961(+)
MARFWLTPSGSAMTILSEEFCSEKSFGACLGSGRNRATATTGSCRLRSAGTASTSATFRSPTSSRRFQLLLMARKHVASILSTNSSGIRCCSNSISEVDLMRTSSAAPPPRLFAISRAQTPAPRSRPGGCLSATWAATERESQPTEEQLVRCQRISRVVALRGHPPNITGLCFGRIAMFSISSTIPTPRRRTRVTLQSGVICFLKKTSFAN